MEIFYCFIDEFRSLDKVEVNFGGPFRCEYDISKNVLTLKEDPDYIANFFGNQISNVSAIVGKNGAGKSALLEWLIENNISYDKKKGNQIIGFYSKPTESIIIKTNIEKEFGVINWTNKKLEVIQQKDPKPEQTYAVAYFTNSMYDRVELDKRKDRRLAALTLKNEITNSLGWDARKFETSFWGNFQSREYLRILALLQSGIELGIDFPRPKYVVASLSSHALYFIEDLLEGGKLSPDQSIIMASANRYFLKKFESDPNNLLLYQIERFLIANTLLHLPIDQFSFEKAPNIEGEKPGDIFKLFGKWFGEQYDYSLLIQNFAWIQNGESISKRATTFRIAIDNLDRKSLTNLFKSVQSIHMNVSAFLKFSFSFGNSEDDEFSSGEFAILSMISRFYGHKNRIESVRLSSSDPNLLVIIDEGELYLHPAWQKQFVNLLITTLPAIFSETRLQIILSSHSPFILSDIPKNRVTFLKKMNGKCVSVNALEHSPTFAGNIHTLLADSFFLEDGFIGTFAKNKINEVIKDLNSRRRILKDRREEIRTIIHAIGEPIIKNTLLDLYEQKFRLDVDDRLTDLENTVFG